MATQAPLTFAGFARNFLGSPRFSAALTTTIIGSAVFSFALHQLIDWPGYIAILAGLVVLAVASLGAQWREIGWSGLLPISLLGFVGWSCATIFWSAYHWATLAGLLYLLAFAILGVYVALARDTIQIVRAFGDVLRFALALSISAEIFSGILIDTPLRFLGINGRIAQLGPITGLMNTTDQFGLVALIALITFVIELRTKSISRSLGVGSIVLGAASVLLSRAPLVIGATLVVAAAGGVLIGLRRSPEPIRRVLQFAVLALAAAIAIVAWIFRSPIVTAFNATGALTYRLHVWQQVWALTQTRFLQGWGWAGAWPKQVSPFSILNQANGGVPGSALNAYLDVWFQLGIVGFAIFLGFLGLAFVRSWLLASRKRSVVFAWPSLVLVALLVGSLAESFVLVEFGLLTVVVCCVKASRELSWRSALSTPGVYAPEDSAR